MNKTTVLVVAAHPDDEVLGCGGTIAKFALAGHSVHVLLIADGESAREMSSVTIAEQQIANRNKAAHNAGDILGCSSVNILSLPDNRLDSLDLLDIVQHLEYYVEKLQPTTIFTHHAGDINIDHRIVHNAVVTACRPQPNHPVKEILFFEVPSSTEWQTPNSAATFCPNYFVDISTTLVVKIAGLQAYTTELRDFPHPRSLQGVTALAQWRGATVGVNAAEAFMIGRKIG